MTKPGSEPHRCEFQLAPQVLDDRLQIPLCRKPATHSVIDVGGASYWCAEHAKVIAEAPENEGVEPFELRGSP
jgi:hypothetical protein